MSKPDPNALLLTKRIMQLTVENEKLKNQLEEVRENRDAWLMKFGKFCLALNKQIDAKFKKYSELAKDRP